MDLTLIDQHSLDLVHQNHSQTNNTNAQNISDEWVTFVLSLENRTLSFSNHLISEITGYPIKTLYKEGWKLLFSIIHPEDYSEIIKQHLWQHSDNRNIANQLPYHIKIRVKHAQGHWMVIDVQYALIYSKTGLGPSHLKAAIRKLSEPQSINSYRKANHLAQAAPKFNVSKREREVLNLIGKGYTTKQIACELYISTHTVTSHRKNLIDKFKVKNTAELIKEATKVQLLQ